MVVYFRSKGSLWGSLSPKKDTLMTYRTYLIRKTPTSSYLFRIKIPIDLRKKRHVEVVESAFRRLEAGGNQGTDLKNNKRNYAKNPH